MRGKKGLPTDTLITSLWFPHRHPSFLVRHLCRTSTIRYRPSRALPSLSRARFGGSLPPRGSPHLQNPTPRCQVRSPSHRSFLPPLAAAAMYRPAAPATLRRRLADPAPSQHAAAQRPATLASAPLTIHAAVALALHPRPAGLLSPGLLLRPASFSPAAPVSTADEETGIHFASHPFSQVAGSMGDSDAATMGDSFSQNLLNGEQLEEEDGLYGEILAPLKCWYWPVTEVCVALLSSFYMS